MITYPDTFPVPLIHLEETDSTINYLQALCKRQEVEEFTTVVADYQSAGRGQKGNSWEAEADKNLLFSFVLYPTFLEANRQFLLSQVISLAIKEELESYADGFSIKWPNDIYWREKKICGMLIENDLTGRFISQSIAGVGININQERFLSPAPNPVSLRMITRREHGIQAIAESVMKRIVDYYAALRSGKESFIAERYREALFRNKGLHPYRDGNGRFLARLARIEPGGRLILEDEKRKERGYMFKEVEYILED